MSGNESTSGNGPSLSKDQRVSQGPVMPIGGAEDKDGDGGEDILKRFVELAGGERARIVVIPTASEVQEEMGQR